MKSKISRPVLRLLDANLNRAREGLRVVEDVARFVLVHASLYRRLRAARRELAAVASAAYPKLVRSRDSARDPGGGFPETRRRNQQELVAANFGRVTEAIRVLEEHARLLSVTAGWRLKRIRFRVYRLETEMARARRR